MVSAAPGLAGFSFDHHVLEVLARNEAAKMHADTIKPLAEPAEGSQPWGAYQCGANRPAPTGVPARSGSAPGQTQTFPIHGG